MTCVSCGQTLRVYTVAQITGVQGFGYAALADSGTVVVVF
jgi:hypothetical protein